MPVPASVSLVDELGLPGFEHATIDGKSTGTRLGMRLLVFRLEPGERLKVGTTGISQDKLELSLGVEGLADPIRAQVEKVNRRPSWQRNRGIELHNLLAEPCTVVLKVAGFAGYPYRLRIQREK